MRKIAILLTLFRIEHAYEVRKTFGKSDRKVSGRLIHGGPSLTAAMARFHRADKTLKEGESIRIQIVIPLLGWMSPLVSPSPTEQAIDQSHSSGQPPVVPDHTHDRHGPMVEGASGLLRESCSVCGAVL